MKAIILAGGLGTRLAPITDKIPKALVPMGSRTLTEEVLSILGHYGIHDIMLSIAHKKDQIKEKFGPAGKRGKGNIAYIKEDQPLGTAGPLIILNKQGKPIQETFFMVNGDNLFDVDLKAMLDFHRKKKGIATIALSMVKNAKEYGVAVLDGDKIIRFIEKPQQPPSEYINSGYYLLEPEVFGLLKGKERGMMEKDVFPQLAGQGKLYGFRSDGIWFDTGTLERYEKAKREWKFQR